MSQLLKPVHFQLRQYQLQHSAFQQKMNKNLYGASSLHSVFFPDIRFRQVSGLHCLHLQQKALRTNNCRKHGYLRYVRVRHRRLLKKVRQALLQKHGGYGLHLQIQSVQTLRQSELLQLVFLKQVLHLYDFQCCLKNEEHSLFIENVNGAVCAHVCDIRHGNRQKAVLQNKLQHMFSL